MKRVLFAEFAVFLFFDTFRVVFLVLHRIVISLLAFCARERYFNSHRIPSVLICKYSLHNKKRLAPNRQIISAGALYYKGFGPHPLLFCIYSDFCVKASPIWRQSFVCPSISTISGNLPHCSKPNFRASACDAILSAKITAIKCLSPASVETSIT